jgi:hypothetical protein
VCLGRKLPRSRLFPWLLQAYDADGSGTIDRSELETMLSDLCVPMTREEMDELMDQLDKDGSGAIDFEEFHQWFIYIGAGKRSRMVFQTLMLRLSNALKNASGVLRRKEVRRSGPRGETFCGTARGVAMPCDVGLPLHDRRGRPDVSDSRWKIPLRPCTPPVLDVVMTATRQISPTLGRVFPPPSSAGDQGGDDVCGAHRRGEGAAGVPFDQTAPARLRRLQQGLRL